MSQPAEPGEPEGSGPDRVGVSPAAQAQMDQFCAAHHTQVLTILLSDLEGSTARQSQLGNVRAASLVRLHRGVFRETLHSFDGLEVETAGDSFLVVFAAPSEGVKFALHMQAAMRRVRQQEPELPLVRAGIHQGQVIVERHDGGPKALDIYGLQVSTAARIADLACGGQVLCSRAVFDDARAILRGEDLQGLGTVAWCNHGPYRFKGVADTHEVCEVGEEGHAPLEAPPAGPKGRPADQADEDLGWRPAVGVTVPGTNWVLEARLGEEREVGKGDNLLFRGEKAECPLFRPRRYRGEFGEVWKAWNPQDRSRQVFKFCFRRDRLPALKREARLLKRLARHRHPNLVEVHDVTESDRPPYYLEMEYVEGPLLEEWLAAGPPLAERLELIAQVADALDTVHAAGIYHRDIKPSNILLTHREDGTLLAKLSDFGLGAAEDERLLKSICASRIEGVAGTWDYLAPELRSGGAASPQSDLYSLGVTLYQVAVGDLRRPLGDWEGEAESEVLREDIRRCVATDPARRWRRAADLARALRGHDQRLRELCSQRRAARLRLVAGIAGLFALVLLLFGGYAWHQRGVALDAQRSERRAREGAEAELYHSTILLAQQYVEARQHDLATRALWQAPERHRRWEWGYLLARAQPFLFSIGSEGHPVLAAELSPDGRRIATASSDRTAKLWDAETGGLLFTLAGHTGPVTRVRFSPNSQRVVTASADKTARVWDTATGKELFRLEGHERLIQDACFSRDGRYIATLCGDFAPFAARIWDSATGARLHVLPMNTKGMRDDQAAVLSMAIRGECAEPSLTLRAQEVLRFSPDSRLLATRRMECTVAVWEAETGKQAQALSVQGSDRFPKAMRPLLGATCIEFAPGGEWLLAVLSDGTARTWRVGAWTDGLTLKGDAAGMAGIKAASYDPQGTRIVTASGDKTARVWDARDGKLLRALSGHTDGVLDARFSPDGARIITALSDGTAGVWDAESGAQIATLAGHLRQVTHAGFCRDGHSALSVSLDHTVKLWHVESARVPLPLSWAGNERAVACFSPDGRRIVTSSEGPQGVVWDSETGRRVLTLQGHAKQIEDACYDAAGRRIATASADGTAKLWDAATGREALTLPGHRGAVHSVAFSPTGERLVAAADDKTARVWDAASGAPLLTLQVGSGPARGAWFSPDGALIVTEAQGRDMFAQWGEILGERGQRSLQVWDAASGQERNRFAWSRDELRAARFSPDGRRVVTHGAGGIVRLWDRQADALLAVVEEKCSEPLVCCFSPDGRWLLLLPPASECVSVYDGATGTAVATLGGHEGEVADALFSPDSARVVTVSEKAVGRVWDPQTGRMLCTFQALGCRPGSASFSPDGARFLIASGGALGGSSAVQVWSAAPWRAEDLPGGGPWEQRYRLWRLERYRAAGHPKGTIEE